ncbi:hypothetical protein [Pseudomonas sp. R5(2019)]|uniref:hypothetical protein n=1 Tax=Pseudomonas sp. R5(2019) TaxID=2697566 RepID=UPI0014122112|nr:hypothetical protein [Pseudomonas sp. R5(2019)]NBA94671.1 hypothetical protein [Pseudomonas sp. R5(2019)]
MNYCRQGKYGQCRGESGDFFQPIPTHTPEMANRDGHSDWRNLLNSLSAIEQGGLLTSLMHKNLLKVLLVLVPLVLLLTSPLLRGVQGYLAVLPWGLFTVAAVYRSDPVIRWAIVTSVLISVLLLGSLYDAPVLGALIAGLSFFICL